MCNQSKDVMVQHIALVTDFIIRLQKITIYSQMLSSHILHRSDNSDTLKFWRKIVGPLVAQRGLIVFLKVWSDDTIFYLISKQLCIYGTSKSIGQVFKQSWKGKVGWKIGRKIVSCDHTIIQASYENMWWEYMGLYYK